MLTLVVPDPTLLSETRCKYKEPCDCCEISRYLVINYPFLRVGLSWLSHELKN